MRVPGRSMTPRGPTALAIACCALAAGMPARAGQRDVAPPLPPIRAADLFDIAYALDPAISPDGRIAVYRKEWMHVATDDYRGELRAIDLASGRDWALTGAEADVGAAIWSPDGRTIAFVANAPAMGGKPGQPQADRQIHLATPADGGGSRRLGALPQAASRLAWSPDGTRIAFVMKVPAAAPRIGAAAAPPPGARWRPAPFVTERLRFRYDDAGLIGDETYDVHVMTVATGAVRRLTRGEAVFGGPLATPGSLSWSPDGRTVVGSARTDRESQYAPRESDVYGIDAATGAVRRLTTLPGGEARAAISPDGRWLAFLRTERSDVNHQDPELAVMPLAGGEPRVLSRGLDRPVSTLQWAADSRAVYANYDDRGISRLARFELDGAIAPVAEKLGSWALAYGWAATFSVAKDGSFVMTTADEATPGDVAAGQVGRPGTRRVTRLSDAFLARRARSRIERFQVTARDGVAVEGWLVAPPGFDPAKRYPLILSIHGGPHLYFGPRWDYRHEVMAGAGYVVAYINPRGSTGYGEAFAQATDKRYPGADYPDFEAAADHLAALPFVDAGRMYVTGGSGGGTLSAHIIGRTRRYRAAVIEYPVVDYTSWSLLADNPAVYTRNWSGGFPWTNQAGYDALSPLLTVGEVTTPTMLVCGEDDARTPIGQCEMYYTALKLRDVEAALVRYPDEPHEIEAYPSNRVSEINLLLGWFARFGGPAVRAAP